MRVGNLELHDFRSYETAQLEFQPGVNVLIGPNGVGKTNIVEAVGYASTLDSHRVAADLPLIRSGAESAVIRLEVILGGRTLRAEIAINPGRSNRLQISGSPVRPRDFVGQLRSVTFAPEDLALVKGDPAERRKFLDDVLAQRAPRYSGVRSDYERVVRQRSTLLKSLAGARSSARSEAESTLQVWDDQLATTGASLLFGRLSLLGELAPLVNTAYAAVAPGKPASLSYDHRSLKLVPVHTALPRSVDQLEQILRDEIASRRSDELARGVTLVGPHRDDVTLTIGDLTAKSHASHGECWSLALALRLGSFELMRLIDDGGGDPVLILDDVFAELDQGRRNALVKVADSSEQVLVTAAVAQDVPDILASASFIVTEGAVQRD